MTQRIEYTEEMVGNAHPTKADTLNRFINLITAQGDILYGTAAATAAALAKGTARKMLAMNAGATAPEWVTDPVIKGWIQFNGTGVIAIQDSFNVSGIIDYGTGDYSVTWDTDFANDDYSAVVSCYDAVALVRVSGVGGLQIYTTDLTINADSAIVTAIAIGDQ